MRTPSAAAALLAMLVILGSTSIGCGDTGATKDESREIRAKAMAEGEEVGRYQAEAGLPDRLKAARDKGYWRGWDEGYDEGEESALEFERELTEEFEEPEGSYINPEPINKYGEPSQEFEPDDIERAEEADQSVREYCEGAVSEAQEVGCLSHVNPGEVP